MSAYCVQLDIFSGPLDLLLYLVRRNEVDILDLPIARITASFLDYLDVLQMIDLDLAGDFVVMASTLMEIKSRMVLPQPEVEERSAAESGDDPRSDLIRQLLEYKKYRDAARALEQRAAEWQERYPRRTSERPSEGKDLASDFIRDVELWDLVSALGRVLRTRAAESHASIRYDETPICVYMERIEARVRAQGRVAFSSLFAGENERSRIVGVFLAILELLRHHGYRAEQPVEYGEIWVLPPAAQHIES
jgi:segregation and condensation protein A